MLVMTENPSRIWDHQIYISENKGTLSAYSPGDLGLQKIPASQILSLDLGSGSGCP